MSETPTPEQLLAALRARAAQAEKRQAAVAAANAVLAGEPRAPGSAQPNIPPKQAPERSSPQAPKSPEGRGRESTKKPGTPGLSATLKEVAPDAHADAVRAPGAPERSAPALPQTEERKPSPQRRWWQRIIYGDDTEKRPKLDTTDSGVDKAIAGINARVAKDLQELQVLQGRFKANEEELKKIRGERAELMAKLRSLSATATAEKAELDTKLKLKETRLTLVEANLKALEKEFADAKNKFESDLTEERKAVKKLGSDLAEAQRIGRTSGTELAAATQRIQMLDSQLQKMAAIIESSSILTQVGDARLIELGELNERLRQEIERMRSDKGDAASREDFVQEQAETIGRLRAELADAQEEIGRLKTALETSQQGATKLAEAMAKQPLESVPKGVALDELPSLQGIFTLLAQVDRGPALDRLLTLLGKTLATKGLNAAQMEQSLGKIVTGLQKAIDEERANEAARRTATVVSESSPIAPAPETPEQPEV